jgi:hypothetical protein
MSNVNNKKYLNGVWMLLHRMCLNGRGDDYVGILSFIELLVKNTGCDVCNKHAQAYLQTTDPTPKKAFFLKGYEGLFEWTVNFHNSVNARIGKPQLELEDARTLYLGDCLDCTVKEEKKEKQQTPEDFIRASSKKKPIIF